MSNLKDVQQIQSLIAKGKGSGYLTFEEVNKALPVEMSTPEQFEEIIGIFDGYLENTVFIAFNIANLDLVRKVAPEQTVQFLSGGWKDELPDMLAERKMDLDIGWGALTEERIRLCHDRGIKVNCWTVDDPEKAETLIGWGVDYITSNILE